MPTPRRTTRDPLAESNATRSSSLKRKRESGTEISDPSPRNTPKKSQVRNKVIKAVQIAVLNETDGIAQSPVASVNQSRIKKTKTVSASEEVNEGTGDDHESDCGSIKEEKTSPLKRKRKTQEEKDAEAMPLAARTAGLRMLVGAHCSIAKGLENSVKNCKHIGGNAFALFLKSQRKWENPPLKDESRDAFRKACAEEHYDPASHVLPHGSYLVNLATEDSVKAKQAYEAFMDDLHRCEALGIKYYNFHPGASGKAPLNEAIGRISAHLNRALAETKTVVPVLENMCGSGTVIGSRFSDLRDIIAGVKPEYRSRIGVCIDTCHAFAAGNDLRSPEGFKNVLEEFDGIVGMKYLKALHLNDSKAPFGSHRDLHQNIGLGFLGLRGFHNVMNEKRFENMPMILETPCDKPDPDDPSGKKVVEDKSIWAREIKLLESLIGMDAESDEFKKLEKKLSDQGKEERAKMQKSFDSKNEKTNKKIAKEKEKGQKSLSDMFGGGKNKTKTAASDDEEVD